MTVGSSLRAVPSAVSLSKFAESTPRYSMILSIKKDRAYDTARFKGYGLETCGITRRANTHKLPY